MLEEVFARYVAEGPDAFHAGLHVLVAFYVSELVGLDPGFVQLQQVAVGYPSGRDQEVGPLDRFRTGRTVDKYLSAFLLDPLGAGSKNDRVLLGEDFGEIHAYLLILVRKQAHVPLQDYQLGTHRADEMGQLTGDVASPYYYQLFRKLCPPQRFVAGHVRDFVKPLKRRQRGPCAGGDDDLLGSYLLPSDFELLGSDEDAPFLEQGYVFRLAQALLYGFGIIVHYPRPGHHFLEVHRDRADLYAERPGLLDGLHYVGAMDQYFRGYAAAIEAGASHGSFLDQRYFHPALRRSTGDIQTGACPYDDKIEFHEGNRKRNNKSLGQH